MNANILTKTSTGGRNSNLELYRIVVMLFIIAHHYVVNSPLMDIISDNPLAKSSIALWLFGMWGKTGIDCFVLITGYFMCRKSISLRKFLKLFLEVEFYSIVVYVIFAFAGYETLSVNRFFQVILPVRHINGEFVSCFLMFYLCIPFLNVLVNNLNKKQHFLLVILGLTIYSFFMTVPGFSVNMNLVSWFSVLYFIASYIRFYGLFPKINHKGWGWLTLLSMFLSMASVVILLYMKKYLLYMHQYTFVGESGPLAVTTAVCSFMYFKDLKIRQSRFINLLGATTFGVLLIHINSEAIMKWIWQDMFNNVSYYASPYMFLHAIACVLCLYAVCTIIDYVRIQLFEKPFFKWFDRKFDYYI